MPFPTNSFYKLSGRLFLVFAIIMLFSVMVKAQPNLSQPLARQWLYQNSETLNFTPAIIAGDIFLPLATGRLVNLRTSDGTIVWRAELGGEVSAAPLADVRAVYIASEIPTPSSSALVSYARATGTIRAIGRTSGVTLWMRTLSAPLRGSLTADDTTLFGASPDGNVYAFDKTNGAIRWQLQFRLAFNSQPALYNSKLYIGSEDGTLLALNQITGAQLWRYRTRGSIRGKAIVAEGMVFFGSSDGFVYALDESTGALRWRARTGAGVQSVAFVGGANETSGGVVAASFDNFVYFFSSSRGTRLWKRLLAGRIAAQPLVVARNVLLAPLSGDACVVLEVGSGRQVNSLSVGDGNNTAASPALAESGLILITTRQGLIAFSEADRSANVSRD